MAVEGGFLEVIGEYKGNPVDASTIAKKTGYDTLLIGMDVFWNRQSASF